MFKNILNKCVNGELLTEQEAQSVMDEIMTGKASQGQIASLISLLRFRGETVDELVGFSKSMRAHMTHVEYEDESVIDTCGTGGDGASTFNISTTSTIILSSLGVKVAKHGNRAVSSTSGSADVLEYLGINIQATPEEAKESMNENGMSFLFAPLYHAAMRYAATPRKDIGFRTIFNILGPIANPANCKYQLIGVYDTTFADKMAQALHRLGSKRVLLVTGRDGLDECTITTESDIVELNDGKITRTVITPEQFGLERGTMDEIRVSSVSESARVLEDVLSGRGNKGATNIVLLNAGVGLYAAEKAKSIKDGVKMAKAAIDQGLALQQLNRLRNTSQHIEEKQNYA
ncbi:anthranilate phosphoribosyltransferase [Calidifontibacillus oryziterrae]|uniref:anthranilate phosphoribosyltransferase n=1 Tax=Calidifontibacillus oryziterrae TaxID=1191699 RepID=UPI0002EAF92A|nr:anthranilate phosphoribosyltransferase [Calidifontibacillus oryziterrae]